MFNHPLIKGEVLQISIITVTLNDLSRLKRTADSILTQISPNFEWVIIDGFSEDGTREFLEELKRDPRVRSYSQIPNGIYSAMNLGALKATGDYLWFLNAGDYFNSQKSVEAASLELTICNTGILISPVIHVDARSRIQDLSIPYIQENDMGKEAHVNHQGVLVSTNLFRLISGFDTSLSLAADGKFLDHAVSLTEPVLSKQIFVAFEIGGTAAQNFERTIREISTYRKNTPRGVQLKYMSIKNWIKIRANVADKNQIIFLLLRPLFKRRTKKVLRSIHNNQLKIV